MSYVAINQLEKSRNKHILRLQVDLCFTKYGIFSGINLAEIDTSNLPFVQLASG